MPRVNLFIADGVGLGKTIEAGLIARELLLRRKVADIVVCCPPSMVLQWREEMESRFGLLFQILDRAYVHRIRKERGLQRQPLGDPQPVHHLAQPDQGRGIRRRPADLARARPRAARVAPDPRRGPPRRPGGGGGLRDHSQFTRTVEEFAAAVRAQALPLGDPPQRPLQQLPAPSWPSSTPSASAGASRSAARRRDQVMIYRLKDDLREIGVAGFPRREVVPVPISAPVKGTPELELAAKLEDTAPSARIGWPHEPVKVRNASAFLGRASSSGSSPRSRPSGGPWASMRDDRRKLEGTGGEPRRSTNREPGRARAGRPSAAGWTPTRSAKPTRTRAARGRGRPRDRRGRSPDREGDPGHARRHRSSELRQGDGPPRRDARIAEPGAAPAGREAQEALRLHRPEHGSSLPPLAGRARDPSGTTTGSSIFTEYDDTLAYVRRHLEAGHRGDRPRRASAAIYRRRAPRSRNARRSRRRSTPTPPTTPSGSCSPPTRPARA